MARARRVTPELLLLLLLAAAVTVATPGQPPPNASSAHYSQKLAAQLLHYSEAAYCPGAAVQAWRCPPCREQPSLNVSLVVSDTKLDTHGFVGLDSRGGVVGGGGEGEVGAGRIVVAFRGTDPLNIASWLVDLRSAVLVHWPSTAAACAAATHPCKVGAGWYAAYSKVRNRTLGAVMALRASHPRAEIELTGHSLGAAYVALLAMDLWYACCYTA
eukprot:COSAG01_NODE_292_length_19376_cov_61.487239_5_plen_215_part_00